ncbi:MAG: alanine--glyoxylate aminotransferase family protein [Chloroflexi bacterium]|nr:alanine--glyoxylate aminotransferase family protein [Chloroflexota bacterium]
MKQHKKLMIPGPVDIFDETLDALAEQVLPHYGADWSPIYWETIEMLQQVFQTKNDIAIFTAPGSGAVETCVASLFAKGEKVAAVSNGPFANRKIEIMKHFGVEVIEVTSEWGTAVDVEQVRATLRQHPDIAGVTVVANETGTGVRNPVQALATLAHEYDLPIFVDAISGMGGYNLPVDAWALDLICTSSNKALEVPPGLGIVAVSERAWKVIEAKKATASRGWYYNLSTWKQYYEAGLKSDMGSMRSVGAARPVPTATTQATGLIVALNTSLKRILRGETLQGHWARYAWAQQVLRTGLRNIGFEMLVRDEDASFTVTTVRKRADMDNEQELREFLAQKHNYFVSGAGGPLAGQVMRIGHMGRASTPEYLFPFLLGIEDYVRSVKEVDIPVGTSLIGLATAPVMPTK